MANEAKCKSCGKEYYTSRDTRDFVCQICIATAQAIQKLLKGLK